MASRDQTRPEAPNSKKSGERRRETASLSARVAGSWRERSREMRVSVRVVLGESAAVVEGKAVGRGR